MGALVRKGAGSTVPLVARRRRSGAGTLPRGVGAAGRVARVFPNLKHLFSTGAGIDQFDLLALPASLPIVLMIEPGIVVGMVEYVPGVLELHWPARLLRAAAPRAMANDPRATGSEPSSRRAGFRRARAPRAREARRVRFCVRGLESVAAHDRVGCFAGESELPAFLARTDILVCVGCHSRTPRRHSRSRSVCRIAPRGLAGARGARVRIPPRAISWPRSMKASSRQRCSTCAIPSRRGIQSGRTCGSGSRRTARSMSCSTTSVATPPASR